MIPFDFEYYRPETVEDAIAIFKRLDGENKNPLYYGGGTEIISMARMSNIVTGGVIDLKGLDELNILELKDDKLTIGAANSLRKVIDSDYFPLLGQTLGRIADHTIQGQITLGGNLAGTIIYKEAMLPLLITDSQLVIDGLSSRRSIPLMDVLNRGKKLAKGDLIVKVIIDKSYLDSPFIHVKRTKYEKIDYPLITMSGIKHKGKIRLAFSGLCEYPYRSLKAEEIINDTSLSAKERIDGVIEKLEGKIISNISGSKEYRKFLLSHLLEEGLEKLEKVDI